MELLSVFLLWRQLCCCIFKQTVCKKSVIGYRTHMAYYQEANSMSYCGMIGLLAAVLFVKAWIGFPLLAFVAAIFHLFVFKKIKNTNALATSHCGIMKATKKRRTKLLLTIIKTG